MNCKPCKLQFSKTILEKNMEAVCGWVSDLKKQDVTHSPTNVKVPAKGQSNVTHFL